MACPICEKRKPGRFCPAKGETICPVCCGTEREVTIDCPADCAYLRAAHRYENDHPRPVPADAPFLDVDLPRDVVRQHQQLLSGLAFSVAKFASAHPAAADSDALAALQSLAETYKTLSGGILYEKPPEAPLPHSLYSALAEFLTDTRKQGDAQAAAPPAKDSQIFSLLVFLYRMGLLRANGRPRSRRFLEFLRGQFPQSPELQREAPRIILP